MQGAAVRVRRRLALAIGRAGINALIIGAYALVVVLAIGWLGDHDFEPSDDPPLYLTLPEKLVQAGSMLEPFAARRASILGGQVYLHAMFLSVAAPYYVHVVDGGLCAAVVLGLLHGHVKGSVVTGRRVAALVLVLFLFFALRSVHRNIGSEFSGIVAMLTLYRTLRIPMGREPGQPSWPMETNRVVALGALTIVTILLRPSNMAAMIPFIAFVFGAEFLLANRRPWVRKAIWPLLRVVGVFAVACAVTLLPWSVMLEQSSGTFFFPLGHSNMTPGFSYLRPAGSLLDAVTNLEGHIFHGRPIAALIPFVVVGLIPLAGRQRNDLVALTLGVVVGMVSLAKGAAQFDVGDTSRWYFGYVAALALLTAGSVERDWTRATLVAVPITVQLVMGFDEGRDDWMRRIALACRARENAPAERKAWDGRRSEYLDVQSHVPTGATMVTAVFDNCLFDFGRNEIFVLDVLGGMGPKPGWPLHKGSEALAKYLQETGIQYLVFVDFSLPSEFYNRAHWQSHLSKKELYLSTWAPIQLDAEDAIEGLPRVRRAMYSAHGMTLVDLTAPPAGQQ